MTYEDLGVLLAFIFFIGLGFGFALEHAARKHFEKQKKEEKK